MAAFAKVACLRFPIRGIEMEMQEKLLKIESLILETLRDAKSIKAQNDQWQSFVGRLENAIAEIWQAMDDVPEVPGGERAC
jgi:hypothetical protein